MIVVGYNVGLLCFESWMDECGDLCLGEMDIVDWIEYILFCEICNYV